MTRSEPGPLELGRGELGGGLLVVLVGAAGSGKSTWARSVFTPAALVCLDGLREMVSDDPCDQDATAEAVALARVVVAGRLRRGLVVVVDSTGSEPAARAQWAGLAAAAGARAELVVLATPLAECLRRNAARPGPDGGQRWGRRVPEPRVRAQYAAAEKLLRAAGVGDVAAVAGYHLLSALYWGQARPTPVFWPTPPAEGEAAGAAGAGGLR